MKLVLPSLSQRFIKRTRKLFRHFGFSFIELIVAITVLSIISTIGIYSFVEYNQTQNLSEATKNFLSAVQIAKSRASTQVKPQACGVNTLEGYKVRLCGLRYSPCFTSGDYEVRVTCGGTDYLVESQNASNKFAGSVKFDPAYTSSDEFFFRVLTGVVENSGTAVIMGNGRKNQIQIDSFGNVRVSDNAILTGPTIFPKPTIVSNSPVPTSTSAPTPTTVIATATPVVQPTATPLPQATPTNIPTNAPTAVPTAIPTSVPTQIPTAVPTAVPSGNTIAGYIWNDADRDGNKDLNEAYLSGWTVTVENIQNSSQRYILTTNSNGAFSISGLANGYFETEVTVKSGYYSSGGGTSPINQVPPNRNIPFGFFTL